jgi:hypothetical protein
VKENQKEEMLSEELRRSFIALSEQNGQRQGENRWLDNITRLHELVMSEDPREFLQWDVIKRTMEVGDADYIETELNFLKIKKDWNRWKKGISEVSAGKPTLSSVYPKSSGNLIHHAYHVAQFENITAEKINDVDCIFEFGGGYGGMYRLMHNIGFKGKYIIFDFPEFSLLQQYFIKSIGLKTHTIETFKNATDGVICISDINVLQDVISNHISSDNNMFLATWSLSECPFELRTDILSLVADFKKFLIAYQGRFEGIDNRKYFNDWVTQHQKTHWMTQMIEHIPNEFYQNNFYLMGSEIN